MAVRFVSAKNGPEKATKTRQYDLLRPRVGQKEPPRLNSTICYGQTWARKSQQNSAVRFVTAKSCTQDSAVTAKSWPGGATRLGSTIRYGQELARKSHQDSAVRFVTANVGQKQPPRLGSTICYGQELALRFVTAPRVGQKKPPRLGSTICYGQTWARKSHQDSAVRFVTAKHGPEGATKTRPRVGQKEPPRLGSTICYGQELARKSHQDSEVRFVTAKSWPERATNTLQYDFLRPTARATKTRPGKATKTRQYDLSRPNVGQTKPPRLGRTICYGQTWARKSQRDSAQELARKSHQDSAVRFVTANRGPERASETRQYDLSRPNVGQKEPPRFGSTICYGQTWARKSHQDSAVRFVTAKSWPEGASKTRQYDLLRPNVGQKEPPRLGGTICYGQELARKSHQDSAVRFVTAKSWPERATETRQYDFLRPRVGQKEPPRLGSTICYGQEWARKSHQDSAIRFFTAKSWPEKATTLCSAICYGQQQEPPRLGSQKKPPRLGSTICHGQTWARKSHRDSAVRFVTAKRGPARLGSTICYGQELARKSHQDSAVRFVTANRGPERATETRQYDLLRPNVGEKEPPSLGNTICYGKTGPERATKTRQYDLLRPRVGQKEPPRLGSTICYGQTWARNSHQNSAVRFVTAKSWPEKATKTRQYDLLRPRVGQKKPARPGSTICYGQDLLRPNVGQKEPARLGSTICYGQELSRNCYGQTWPRKSHQDSAVRFVTAKSWPERATQTRQYDLLRPNVGQKQPPKLGSTICYGQESAKRWPERATKTRQYDEI